MSIKLFRTAIAAKESLFGLDYSDKILTLGSCFADRIGGRLKSAKFNVCQNPFGVLFHLISIENLIRRSLLGKQFTASDFFFHQGLWKSYHLHSVNHSYSVEDAVFNANAKLEILENSIKNSSVVIFTLGTAWVYCTADTMVASCHKQPITNFDKRILSVEQLTNSLFSINDMISEINPEIRFLWTISPIRHIKDGFIENNRSKSHMIVALHRFLDEVSSKKHFYFPAYELLMDDLRDYRFYAEDMIHPSGQAVEYIWEYFKDNYWSISSKELYKRIDKIQKSLQHRPFNDKGEEYLKFQRELHQKIQQITEEYSYIRFEND